MRQLLIASVIYSCGWMPMKPIIPPWGCKDTQPVCICDQDQNCEWQFICIKD